MKEMQLHEVIILFMVFSRAAIQSWSYGYDSNFSWCVISSETNNSMLSSWRCMALKNGVSWMVIECIGREYPIKDERSALYSSNSQLQSTASGHPAGSAGVLEFSQVQVRTRHRFISELWMSNYGNAARLNPIKQCNNRN